MYFANDSKGTRVYIHDAIKGETYFCPICGQEVIQRKGNINAYHYAHKTSCNELCDSWSYDMSEWHREWQSLFPKDNRETIIHFNGIKHRADVQIDKTVIEFQHSRISDEEFWKRNEFYTNAGYEVIWLFDMIEEYNLCHISPKEKAGHYKWNYYWHIFEDFVPKDNKKIKVFFQFTDKFTEGYCGIEQLAWISPDGKHFVTNSAYNQKEWVYLFIKNEVEEKPEYTSCENIKYTIADVQDLLIECNGVYYPCFAKNNSGECFENCDCCKYSVRCITADSIGKKYREMYNERPKKSHASYESGCLYRFVDILEDWNLENDRVTDVVYDDEYKILELSVVKKGELITKKYSPMQNVGKTLLEILRTSDSVVIGALNLHTGVRVKVGNSDFFRRNNIYSIKGYIGYKKETGYSNEQREIFGWNKQEWILEWSK